MKLKFNDFGRCLICLQNPCECKEALPSWQEQFDKKYDGEGGFCHDLLATKDFIRQTIKTEREQAVREVLREIDNIGRFDKDFYKEGFLISHEDFNNLKVKYLKK